MACLIFQEVPQRSAYIVDEFKDLPEELQIRILSEGITHEQADKHFEPLLYILHFKTKHNFYTTEMYELRRTGKYKLPKRRNEGHSLISPEIVSLGSFADEAVSLFEDVPKKNYKIRYQIGKGGYGKIFSARSLIDQTSVAIKRIPHQGGRVMRKNFQEIRFLRYCRGSPHILQFYRATQYYNEIWIVTECIDGVSLMELVMAHEFLEPEISFIIRGVVKGLCFLHTHMIAHRDFKSGNIMLSRDGVVKIIDFGLSSDMSQGEVTHMVGSPFWMPPEMIVHKPHGLLADIWSMGITAMEMANGHPPHRKSPMRAMFVAATVGYPTPFKLGSRWSSHFHDFLMRCLRRNPKMRWSAQRLASHPFLSKHRCAPIEHMRTLMAYLYE